MGRRSNAQSLVEDLDEVDDREGIFIIVYDFHGFKPSKRFWENLKRISDENKETGLIQYSVYKAYGVKEALVVSKLAESYGAETLIFSVEEYTQ
ncbi:hypothetical protein MUP51_10780 [Candidatus Bathyarchaeota archaeon]|nr:hypothetical protein [Candidatus Bathyarchaeota archaeon]